MKRKQQEFKHNPMSDIYLKDNFLEYNVPLKLLPVHMAVKKSFHQQLFYISPKH